MIADINNTLRGTAKEDPDRRGATVYTLSQLMAVSGRTKTGEIVTGTYDQSLFYLNYEERINIFRLCSPVHAVVTGRMNMVAGMDFEIINERVNEDKQYEILKAYKSVVDEYAKATDIKYVIARGKLIKEIMEWLPDVLPDLSNFQSSLLRWRKRNRQLASDSGEWIKEWMLQPNISTRYEELIKQSVFDLMIHGAVAWYKEVEGGKIENVYCLPGGSVTPLKEAYAGGSYGFVQVMRGWTEPKIYFSDEMAYASYIPNTARSYGFIPLEALINKIAESMFFDKLMAEQADGTKMPEKMIIITEDSPFGELGKEFKAPINDGEQKRIEEKINTPRKGAMMTFSGNNVAVVDLSRENTMSIQMQRQKDIRDEVGLIFQATPIEMNLTGGDNTSGRSTSEVQRELYHSRGVLPIIKIIEIMWNREILPFRFGEGWRVNYQTGRNELEEIQKLREKMATGLFSVNELRQTELNEEPYPEKEFDRPPGQGQAGNQQPDGSQSNPFNMKTLG